MNWFKHKTVAHDDPALVTILDKYGPEGYGRYWLMLEAIAGQMGQSGRTDVTYTARKWASVLRCKSGSSAVVLRWFADLSLIQLTTTTDGLRINCPNLLKIKDEYSQKSGQHPDTIKIKSIDIDKEKEKRKSASAPADPTPPLERFNAFCQENQDWLRSLSETRTEQKPYAPLMFGDGVFVKAQLQLMRLWIEANPQKGNKRNWKTFILNWLKNCRRDSDNKPGVTTGLSDQGHDDWKRRLRASESRTSDFVKIGDVE